MCKVEKLYLDTSSKNSSQKCSRLGGFPTLHGFNNNNDFYIKPYARFQPYLVGLLLGYVLFKLRGKKIHIPQVSFKLAQKIVKPI